MSILLYCVTTTSDLLTPETGVAGFPVLSVEHGDLAALFSESVSGANWAGASLQNSAREFHQVLHRVFRSQAIIPFRFPTVMPDAGELAAHLRDNTEEYSEQLVRFRNAVQMDITIAISERSNTPSQTSGAEYLRERQKQSVELDRIAEALRAQTESVTRDWRTRSVRNGLKVFALLDRDSVAGFKDSLRSLAVPANVSVRVNGPWPVSEFLELAQPR